MYLHEKSCEKVRMFIHTIFSINEPLVVELHLVIAMTSFGGTPTIVSLVMRILVPPNIVVELWLTLPRSFPTVMDDSENSYMFRLPSQTKCFVSHSLDKKIKIKSYSSEKIKCSFDLLEVHASYILVCWIPFTCVW